MAPVLNSLSGMPAWFAGCMLTLLSVYSHGLSLYEPSGNATGVPENIDQPFDEYIQQTRAKITSTLKAAQFDHNPTPFWSGYTLEEVVDIRSPFQIPVNSGQRCSDVNQGADKGFLLIHGLTDSPYLLKGIADSIHARYPCALIRAILLPGHGTVPGDSTTMKHEDWLALTEYGARSLHKEKSITDVYMVGFSTGTALSIRHLQDGESTNRIAGLILLSPAVAAVTETVWLAQYVRGLKTWMSQYQERDAARYESFSFNAVAEFHALTKDLIDEKYRVDIPVLMVLSADDTTINPEANRAFFCELTNAKSKRALIWYEPFDGKTAKSHCADIASIALTDVNRRYDETTYRYANYSHLAVSVPPGDPHYGVNGKFRHCKHYDKETTQEDYEACQAGEGTTLYGETNLHDVNEGKRPAFDYLHRATFNPDYERVEQSILCFIDAQCDLNSVLSLSK